MEGHLEGRAMEFGVRGAGSLGGAVLGADGDVTDFCLILRAMGSPWLMDPEEGYENISILKRSLCGVQSR